MKRLAATAVAAVALALGLTTGAQATPASVCADHYLGYSRGRITVAEDCYRRFAVIDGTVTTDIANTYVIDLPAGWPTPNGCKVVAYPLIPQRFTVCTGPVTANGA